MVPHIIPLRQRWQVVAAVRYARPQDFADKIVIAMVESVEAVRSCRTYSASKASTFSSWPKRLVAFNGLSASRCTTQ